MVKRHLILAIISGNLSLLLFPSLLVFRLLDSGFSIACMYCIFGLLSFFPCFEFLKTLEL